MASQESYNDVLATTTDAEEAVGRFDYVRFTFADTHGIARSKTITRRHFGEMFADGVKMFDVGTMGPTGELNYLSEEVITLNLGNVAVKPVPGTLHALPWAAEGKHRVGEVYCETFWIPPFRDGGHLEACPRYMARRQLDRLQDQGYRLYSGFEAEFILFDAAGSPIFPGNDACVNCVIAEYESFLYSMEQKMAAAGVDVAAIHSEYAEGQFEMALAPKWGIDAADQLFLLKHAVKEMSKQNNGWTATFMSKPVADQPGNGLHYSHSLWSLSEDKNAFYDSKTADGLSPIARHWMAGLMRHGPALMALCSPTVNCYRRNKTPFSPSYVDWGIGYRSAAVRAKTGHPSATYFENRLPGGAANPYLVMAATVAAGIDGIVNKLECPSPMTMSQRSEIEKESDADSPASTQLRPLPSSLSEALDALENDSIMVEALGKEFTRCFVISKRVNEIAKVFKESAEPGGRAAVDIEKGLYLKLF